MTTAEPAWLQVWERGYRQDANRRAVALLAHVCPESSPDSLARLPLGEREAALLDLYERAFGGRIEGEGACPSCGERVEYAFWASDLRVPPGDRPPGIVEHDDYRLKFRLITTADLEALASFDDVDAARQHLAERCLTEATRGGDLVAVRDLPPSVLRALSDEMAASDPQAEILLTLECPECGTTWKHAFEAVECVWQGVTRAARDLMVEIHTLASHYHWSEAEILALPAERRAFYLRLVSA